jgi:hypothetical protein
VIDYLFQAWPIILVIIVYFVRLEKKITQINQDLKWVKKYIDQCQLLSDENFL